LPGREIRAFPNPGRDRVVFQLALDQSAEVKIAIYNFRGERIAVVGANPPAGLASLVWDCSATAPGVYLARLQVDGQEKKKMKIAVVR